jgi:acetyl-CoA C-acetyltransferase
VLERLPVIVGVGQVTNRTDDVAAVREPLALMAEAAAAALADTRAAGLAARIDSVRVVNVLSFPYADPAGGLAARVGLATGERLSTTIGGNTPQWLASRTADDLAAGRIRVALLAGGEAMHALKIGARRGVALGWSRGRGTRVTIGDDRPPTHPDEWRYGAQTPARIYPLFEIALRARERQPPGTHRARLAALSASLAQVAAANPHAWFRERRSADEIAAVTPANRMIAFPYPKLMNAMLEVDQAAALVMTTAATARGHGVPPDRWVYLHGGGDADDLWYLRDRVDYHSSPGMALAFELALEQAGVEAGSLAAVDLYSCFPVAVRFAARVLGLPDDGSRPLTVTGGLPYFGGPGNNYGMHAIATMVERLRAAPGALGLVSGLGWYMTKHAVGVYGVAPPARPWARPPRAAGQARVDALPHPACVTEAAGRARLETYTVLHDRDGAPAEAIVIARLDDGRRAFATTDPDPGLLALLECEEMVGTPGRLVAGGDGRNRFRPAGA